jgi:hypothetical protein
VRPSGGDSLRNPKHFDIGNELGESWLRVWEASLRFSRVRASEYRASRSKNKGLLWSERPFYFQLLNWLRESDLN